MGWDEDLKDFRQKHDTTGHTAASISAEATGYALSPVPPHVADEHEKLLADAQAQFDEYSAWLAAKLVPQNDTAAALNPLWTVEDAMRARGQFLNDPLRLFMARNLAEIKLLVEQPRFLLVKA